jgi:hypothetical protein
MLVERDLASVDTSHRYITSFLTTTLLFREMIEHMSHVPSDMNQTTGRSDQRTRTCIISIG